LKRINTGEVNERITKEGEISEVDFRDIHHVRKTLRAARSLDQGRESKSVFRHGRIGGPVMNDERELMIDSPDDDMYEPNVIGLPEDEDQRLIPEQDADQKARIQVVAPGQRETPVIPEQHPDQKPRGRPFEPGKSGNPQGRPKGSRNKATLVMEALLEGEAENIIGKVIEKAKEGHFPAMRFLGDRLLAPQRSRTVQFELPPIEKPEDAQKAAAAVLAACANGELAPSEATNFMSLIQAYASLTPSEPSAADTVTGKEVVFIGSPADLLSAMNKLKKE
jgi:hypothetical protein